MNSILIKNAIVVTLNDRREVLPETSIFMRDGAIVSLIPKGQPLPQADTILDGRGKAALPGFVNAHTHAAMTLLRGYADDMELQPWLQEKIWPTEAKLQEEEVYWGTLLAAAEMLRAGVTCFNDMYFFHDAAARATHEAGMRACISGVVLGFLPTGEAALKQTVEFAKRMKQTGGLITPMLGPHAPYTCPDKQMEKVIAAAQEIGVGIHIHLSETKKEVEDSLAQYGETPIAHMQRLNMFATRGTAVPSASLRTGPAVNNMTLERNAQATTTHGRDAHATIHNDAALRLRSGSLKLAVKPQVLAAHCVWATDDDIAILAENKVGVAHNPGSNMKLASGAMPTAKMLAAGVPVGLGTDGAASNNNLDILEEARLAALLAKHETGDPTSVASYDALYMATRGGAEALGLGDVIGQITPGRRADIILIDLEQPHLCPPHDIISHLVYSARAGDVRTVLVDGEPRMIDGKLQILDEKNIMARAAECARRLVE
jgi:5-methylthioadenosine/S-adenosylhomocysteine deaminase